MGVSKRWSLGIVLQRVTTSSESEWECRVSMRVVEPWARVMEATELWLEEPGKLLENYQ